MNSGNNQSGMNNASYRDRYNSIIFFMIGVMGLMLLMVILLLYQVFHRPLPTFEAADPKNRIVSLTPASEPNLQTPTILKWATRAAVTAYTFDFLNYKKQIEAAHPYFTDAGWADYQSSISGLITKITQNQLFVNSVVAGAPVISNAGELPGKGYVWRIQIPFLVTYQSSDTVEKKNFTVILTIVRVSTAKNPAAIGVDQFVMS